MWANPAQSHCDPKHAETQDKTNNNKSCIYEPPHTKKQQNASTDDAHRNPDEHGDAQHKTNTRTAPGKTGDAGTKPDTGQKKILTPGATHRNPNANANKTGNANANRTWPEENSGTQPNTHTTQKTQQKTACWSCNCRDETSKVKLRAQCHRHGQSSKRH